MILSCHIHTGIVCVVNTYSVNHHVEPHNKIKLGDIQVLTLEQGRMTSGRRSSPVPQLKCVGGTAMYHSNEVNAIQCTNKGFDGIDYSWKCDAILISPYAFMASMIINLEELLLLVKGTITLMILMFLLVVVV